MQRLPVTSSNIAEVGYDTDTMTLEILFHNASVYQYFDVPQQVFDDLRTAGSPGTYFHQHIRGVYRFARV